jgi:hypothetical protein
MQVRPAVLPSLAAWLVAAAIACSGDPAIEDRGKASRERDTTDRDAADAGSPAPIGTPVEPCDRPGALEPVACGRCGSTQRFCTSDGRWEYGPCESETGACRPGEFREAACGNCGRQREICTDSCGWTTVGTCAGEGVCKPGALTRSREGCATGQRDVRCTDACAYEPVSECTLDRCESPGTTESIRCGNCGTRTRFCAASREWEYGPCTGERDCAPGSARQGSCGNCGSQSSRCNDRCEWVPFGECTNTGECAPGSTSERTATCPPGQTQRLVCSDACRFEPEGSCRSVAGKRGELCLRGGCESPLVCDTGTGTGICRQPCSTDQACGGTICGDSGLRGVDGGRIRTCTDRCTPFTNAGCPANTKCDYIGQGGQGPLAARMVICSAVGTGLFGARCEANSDCAREHVCVVSSGNSGRCTRVCDPNHPCPAPLSCRADRNLNPFETIGLCE